MKFANTINLNRKSGVAQWRDLQFALPPKISDLSSLKNYSLKKAIGYSRSTIH